MRHAFGGTRRERGRGMLAETRAQIVEVARFGQDAAVITVQQAQVGAYMRLDRWASIRRSRTTRRVYTTYEDSNTTSRMPTITSGAPRRIG